MPLPPQDRARLVAWYRDNRARSRAIFDLVSDEAYYSAADRAAQPDRVLRRPSARRSASTRSSSAASAGRASTQGSKSLFARGIDPDSVESAKPRGITTRWPSRERGARVRRAKPTAQVIDASRVGRHRRARRSAARSRRSGVRDPRARGDASGDAALHVAPAAVSTRSAGRPATSRGRRGRAGATNGSTCPAGSATLGVDRGAIPFGWDNEHPARRERVPAFRDRCATTSRTREFLEFVEAGGYRDGAVVAPRGLGVGATRARSSIRSSGSAPTAGGSGAGCSTCCRCRRRGPCT